MTVVRERSLSTEANTATLGTGVEEDRQSGLEEFGMDLERFRYLWDFEDRNQGSDWNVYVTGEPLFSDSYDTIPFVVVTGEGRFHPTGHGEYIRQQQLEPNLLENGDRDGFEQVARALDQPEETDFWHRIDEKGMIPVGQEFEHQGARFRVDKRGNRDERPEHLYPVELYFLRSDRPIHGEEVTPGTARENISTEDLSNLDYVVSALKGMGAQTYLTGSSTRTDEYNDIDLAVGLPLKGTDDARQRHYSIELGRVKRFINEVTGEMPWKSRKGMRSKDAEEVVEQNSITVYDHQTPEEAVQRNISGIDTAKNNEYQQLDAVYRFSIEHPSREHTTEFDLAVSQRPIVKDSEDPQTYAKL